MKLFNVFAIVVMVFIFIVPVVFRKRYSAKRSMIYDKYEGKMRSIPTRLRLLGMVSCFAFGSVYMVRIIRCCINNIDPSPAAIKYLILCIVGGIALHLYARIAFSKKYQRPFGEVLKDYILFGYYSLMLNLRPYTKMAMFLGGALKYFLNSYDEKDLPIIMTKSDEEFYKERDRKAGEGVAMMLSIYNFLDVEGK